MKWLLPMAAVQAIAMLIGAPPLEGLTDRRIGQPAGPPPRQPGTRDAGDSQRRAADLTPDTGSTLGEALGLGVGGQMMPPKAAQQLLVTLGKDLRMAPGLLQQLSISVCEAAGGSRMDADVRAALEDAAIRLARINAGRGDAVRKALAAFPSRENKQAI